MFRSFRTALKYFTDNRRLREFAVTSIGEGSLLGTGYGIYTIITGDKRIIPQGPYPKEVIFKDRHRRPKLREEDLNSPSEKEIKVTDYTKYKPRPQSQDKSQARLVRAGSWQEKKPHRQGSLFLTTRETPGTLRLWRGGVEEGLLRRHNSRNPRTTGPRCKEGGRPTVLAPSPTPSTIRSKPSPPYWCRSLPPRPESHQRP
ncbi:uncharacterized protein [Periplaneta americana]|uniref:uncharacterized protein n=1 Tax=Periplaneta americana TaxID=6978 RepID=UPI0037E7D1A1